MSNDDKKHVILAKIDGRLWIIPKDGIHPEEIEDYILEAAQAVASGRLTEDLPEELK